MATRTGKTKNNNLETRPDAGDLLSARAPFSKAKKEESMCGEPGTARGKGLCHLRYMLYRLYREARHIPNYCETPTFGSGTPQYSALEAWDKPGGMHELATLYADTLAAQEPGQISKPFEDRSNGVTLETLKEDFAAKWKDPTQTRIGGPRWAAICDETIRLRDALLREGDPSEHVKRLHSLPHNRGWPATQEYADLSRDLSEQNLVNSTICCVEQDA